MKTNEKITLIISIYGKDHETRQIFIMPESIAVTIVEIAKLLQQALKGKE